MSATDYQIRGSNLRGRQNKTEWSPFDDMALEYDAWFDKKGSSIFFIEVQAFRELLPKLSKPWLEVGVGSGCGWCVWLCREKLGIGVLGFAHRGFQRVVTTFPGDSLGESICKECGECVRVCPVGALTFKDNKTGSHRIASVTIGINKKDEVYK